MCISNYSESYIIFEGGIQMKNRKKILNFISSITISIDLILVPFNANLINTTETEFNIIKIETNYYK